MLGEDEQHPRIQINQAKVRSAIVRTALFSNENSNVKTYNDQNISFCRLFLSEKLSICWHKEVKLERRQQMLYAHSILSRLQYFQITLGCHELIRKKQEANTWGRRICGNIYVCGKKSVRRTDKKNELKIEDE